MSCVKSFSLTTWIGSLTAFGASFTVAFASSPFVYLGSEGIIRTISSSPALPNALGFVTVNSSSFSIVFGTPFSSASTLLMVAMTFPSLLISWALFPFPAFSFKCTVAFTLLSPSYGAVIVGIPIYGLCSLFASSSSSFPSPSIS